MATTNKTQEKDQATVNTAAPSTEQIAAWKEQHGDIYEIEVEGGVKCWLRKPKRRDMSAAQASGKKDPLKFNDSILNNCWLAGDERIKTDDDLFFGASQVLDELLEFKSATLKKL